MRFLIELGIAPPKAFQATAEFLINIDLQAVLAQDEPDVARLEWLMSDAKRYKVTLDQVNLAFAFRTTLERLIKRLTLKHSDVALIAKTVALAAIIRRMPFQVDLWKAQNDFHVILSSVYQAYSSRESQGEAAAQEWVRQFSALGDQLGVRVQ
jgi:predicted RecB family nuclease